MTFNPKALSVTAAFVALMVLAIAGNAVAVAVALVAEGVKFYFAISGGFAGRAPSGNRLA